MEPFTRSDLKIARIEFATANDQEYIKETVETIYHAVKKDAIEFIGPESEYFYTIHWEIHRNIKHVVEAIRQELIRLFPDFEICSGIEIEKDGYSSHYVVIRW
jgi:intein-encoded DNA endonuclease-like protein